MWGNFKPLYGNDQMSWTDHACFSWPYKTKSIIENCFKLQCNLTANKQTSKHFSRSWFSLSSLKTVSSIQLSIKTFLPDKWYMTLYLLPSPFGLLESLSTWQHAHVVSFFCQDNPVDLLSRPKRSKEKTET